MPNHSISYNNDDSLSFEQPTFEKFYHKNTDVLRKLLKISNQEVWVGLPKSDSLQESINMRSMMIDWLRQINHFRQSKPGVLALAIEIVDNYVYIVSLTSTSRVDSVNYQCVGASAYHLASKLEEVTPITASDMSKFTSESCSASEIMDLEIIISFKLNFNPKFVTPIDFIYLLVGYLELPASEDTSNELIQQAVRIYINVIDNFHVKQFPAHLIAINSIIVGYYEIENDLEESQQHEQLNSIVDTLIKLTNPEKKQLSACYDLINGFIDAKKSQCSELNSSVELALPV